MRKRFDLIDVCFIVLAILVFIELDVGAIIVCVKTVKEGLPQIAVLLASIYIASIPLQLCVVKDLFH